MKCDQYLLIFVLIISLGTHLSECHYPGLHLRDGVSGPRLKKFPASNKSIQQLVSSPVEVVITFILQLSCLKFSPESGRCGFSQSPTNYGTGKNLLFLVASIDTCPVVLDVITWLISGLSIIIALDQKNVEADGY